jgi:N-methylhydantoinase A
MLLGVDVGGTFTDAVAVETERGRVYTAKVPSTPEEQSKGVMEAVRKVIAAARAEADEAPAGTPPARTETDKPPAGTPPARAAAADVERFAHGMTVATNALLEGRVARTALVATEGFTDLIALGRQARADLYRLCAARPEPLAPDELRFGAPERMGPDGPLRPLDREAAEALVEELANAAPEAVAVVLLHSYAFPGHERLIGELLAERLPGTHVSLSHDLVGTFREYERAATTEVDAAISPLLGAYLGKLGAEADAEGLVRPVVMQSSGGLADAATAAAHGALTVLSGPAGGVRGALAAAELAGESDVLCFDMGGTSCDVCVIEGGRVSETAEGEVAGRPLALAMLDIHTVGAGGGSIAWRDPGGALRVGPRSAGADPGPACYGRGGTAPTVTDANLLLGRLRADAPLAGGLHLDRAAAERAVGALAAELGFTDGQTPGAPYPGRPRAERASPLPRRPQERPGPPASTLRCAEGIVTVAEAEMLRALRTMTVERGVDPRDFALMPFGGAGPLHAAALAEALGMRRILCPRTSGVLCALGLAAAASRRDAARTVMLAGETFNAKSLAQERGVLVARASAALRGEVAHTAVRYEMRYRGQSFELPIGEEESTAAAPPGPDALRESFAAAHERRYGYRDDDTEVELVTIRASVSGTAPDITEIGRCLEGADAAPAVRERRRVMFEGRELDAECLRGEPASGTAITGPTVCALPESTLFVPPGWAGEVDAHGTVSLRRLAAES